VTGTDALALPQGSGATRATLAEWRRAHWRVLERWLPWSVLAAVGLLVAVAVIAELSPPDPSAPYSTTLVGVGSAADAGHILIRNSMVLALHALACVAGFLAGSALPRQASSYHGIRRVVHERAGPLAIVFVAFATGFSLVNQALTLGGAASTIAAQLDLSPALLILALLPHALPELAVLFLPLAAWIVASRVGDWDKLLAATLVTVTVALPVLVLSAAVETWVTPRLLAAIAG
jgi:hypothetical protein